MAVNYRELGKGGRISEDSGLPMGAVRRMPMMRGASDSVSSARALPSYWTPAEAGRLPKEPFLKRPLDMALSLLMILLSLPPSLLVMAAIKTEDRGPVFYKQERWGRNGTRFKALKFRTMIPSSDKDFGIKPAEENDHRITRVGKLLRATGLDELPQIINIFLGHMSFVGPRSLAVGEIIRDKSGRVTDYRNVPGFRRRLRARPGLTSIATIYIPKDSPAHRKFRYDLLYIRRQSFLLDLRLIFLSFWISFRGKWETRHRKF
jgi:lipopolysaccharide/colanic/teichoic acid biosynthesis glycosyltransferase